MKIVKRILLAFIIISACICVKSNVKAADVVMINNEPCIEVTGNVNFDWAKQVIVEVNKQREIAGVPALKMDVSLMDSAMQRAAELSIWGAHTRPNGTSCFTVNNKANGENLAIWQTSVTQVMYDQSAGWMYSPGHKANILNSYYKSMGVGVFQDSYGRNYWIQLFSGRDATDTNVRSGVYRFTSKVAVKPTSVRMSLDNNSIMKNDCTYANASLTYQTYTLSWGGMIYTDYTANISNPTFTASNSNVKIEGTKITGQNVGSSTISTTISGVTSNSQNITVTKPIPTVKYQTHVQDIGWQGEVKNGEMSGTSGRSLRLEGIKINLLNTGYTGNVEYSTHVQNIGWQGAVKNGEMSGTSGKSLRLEAITLKLTGEVANHYDIYYRVHCQEIGWMGWAKNGAQAGSEGFGYRLEGIEIKLVEKGGAAPGSTSNAYKKLSIKYQTHVQDIGWQGLVNEGQMSGTSGKALRLEGIKIYNVSGISGNIEYATHVQDIGWQGFVKNGEMSGTSGRSLRLEAIKIRLTGDLEKKYDVYYRVHCQELGWMGWAKNGAQSGSAGYSYRLEGIEICLVEKGGAAPGSTANAFKQR